MDYVKNANKIIYNTKKEVIKMPRGDRTGPRGLGSMTGRRLGYCAGYSQPGFMFPGPGLGFGSGFGSGRGLGLRRGQSFGHPGFANFRQYPYPPVTPYDYPSEVTDEYTILKEQAGVLEDQLEQMKKRLTELEKKRNNVKEEKK